MKRAIDLEIYLDQPNESASESEFLNTDFDNASEKSSFVSVVQDEIYKTLLIIQDQYKCLETNRRNFYGDYSVRFAIHNQWETFVSDDGKLNLRIRGSGKKYDRPSSSKNTIGCSFDKEIENNVEYTSVANS